MRYFVPAHEAAVRRPIRISYEWCGARQGVDGLADYIGGTLLAFSSASSVRRTKSAGPRGLRAPWKGVAWASLGKVGVHELHYASGSQRNGLVQQTASTAQAITDELAKA